MWAEVFGGFLNVIAKLHTFLQTPRNMVYRKSELLFLAYKYKLSLRLVYPESDRSEHYIKVEKNAKSGVPNTIITFFIL